MDTFLVIVGIFLIIGTFHNFRIANQVNELVREVAGLQNYLASIVAFSVEDEHETKVQKEALILSNKYIRDFKKRMDPGEE